MKKEDTQFLNELSQECFGRPYEWRKLRKRGLLMGTDKENPAATRRMPLTTEQAIHYMKTTIEMRKKLQKDLEEKKND